MSTETLVRCEYGIQVFLRAKNLLQRTALSRRR